MTLYDTFASKYITSYAQFGEDICLYDFLYNVKNGFYIDAGASHPSQFSVTKLFYDMGWSGINIDPRPEAIELFNKDRLRDINLCLGVSNRVDKLTFWVCGEVSSFDRENVKRISDKGYKFENITAKVVPLNDILAEHYKGGDIHFLKIDVEHHEKEVLEGVDLNMYRPWMLAVECTLPCTDIACHQEWETLILSQDYSFITQNAINRYYVANEKKTDLIINCLSRPKRLFVQKSHLESLMQLEQDNQSKTKDIQQLSEKVELVLRLTNRLTHPAKRQRKRDCNSKKSID